MTKFKIIYSLLLLHLSILVNAQDKLYIERDNPLNKEIQVLLREKTKTIFNLDIFLTNDCKYRIKSIEINESEGFFDLVWVYDDEKDKKIKDSLFNELLYYGFYDVILSCKKNDSIYIFSYNILFDLVEICLFQDSIGIPKFIYFRRKG